MKTREECGTPYSIGECRMIIEGLGRVIDPYCGGLIAFLLNEIDRQVAEEREACAMICDAGLCRLNHGEIEQVTTPAELAGRIRERSES